MKTGKGYLKKELERIQEVLDEKKLSAFTRTKLNYQINILKSFVDSKARLTTEEVSAPKAKAKKAEKADDKKGSKPEKEGDA